MPILNMQGDSHMKSGAPMHRMASYPGSLDPDLAVGPGPREWRGHGFDLGLAPDRPNSLTEGGVQSMGTAVRRTPGFHVVMETVPGLA